MYQTMFKLQHNCTHFTHQQSNAQNSLSQASIVHEPQTSRCSSWFQKRQRNQRSNWNEVQNLLDHRKSKTVSEKISTSALLTTPKLLTVWITKTVENSEKDGNTRPPYQYPEKSVSRSRSNSQKWTQNNTLVQNQERSVLRLYIVTLSI